MSERLLRPCEECPVCHKPLEGYAGPSFTRVLKFEKKPLPEVITGPRGVNYVPQIERLLSVRPVSNYLHFLEFLSREDCPIPIQPLWNLLPPFRRDFSSCSMFRTPQIPFSLRLERPIPAEDEMTGNSYQLVVYGVKASIEGDCLITKRVPIHTIASFELSEPFPSHS